MLAHASLKSINVPMHLTQTSITTDASPIAVPEAASTATPKLQAKWVGLQELRVHKKAWDALAENALWRNASFESNYLLPALEHLATESVRVMVVERFAANNQSCLVAVVPFVEKRVYRLPFKAIEVWKHDQSFDATPLLSKNFAPFAWQSICEKLIADKYVLLSLDTVLAESRLDLVLRNAETKLGIVRFQRDHFQRAAFTPDQTVESYTKKHVSKSLRKNTGRLLRRLEDIGTVSWETSDSSSDYGQLAEDFLRIEASGWKGKEGTALLSKDSTSAFYRRLVHESALAGKARFLTLKLDGRPIAMLSDIQSGNCVYSFKTAYDDEFSAFSPGQQVELKNLEFLHRDGIVLGDSCTSTSNSTINRIWGQKVAFQNLILSLTPGFARTTVKALPLVQSAVHRLRNNHNN